MDFFLFAVLLVICLSVSAFLAIALFLALYEGVWRRYMLRARLKREVYLLGAIWNPRKLSRHQAITRSVNTGYGWITLYVGCTCGKEWW